MSDTKIKPVKNGPLHVTGPVDIEGNDGILEEKREAFLCRCGGSKQKPYCDGTHRNIEFKT